MASEIVNDLNPVTIVDLMDIVDSIAIILEPSDVIRATMNINKRVQKCYDQSGQHFQHLMK